jgi:hypothetical protein
MMAADGEKQMAVDKTQTRQAIAGDQGVHGYVWIYAEGCG